MRWFTPHRTMDVSFTLQRQRAYLEFRNPNTRQKFWGTNSKTKISPTKKNYIMYSVLRFVMFRSGQRRSLPAKTGLLPAPMTCKFVFLITTLWKEHIITKLIQTTFGVSSYIPRSRTYWLAEVKWLYNFEITCFCPRFVRRPPLPNVR